jgi:hypothetical protein
MDHETKITIKKQITTNYKVQSPTKQVLKVKLKGKS